MYKKLCLSVLVASALMSNAGACFAQDEINDNQPVKGPLNKTEARIRLKMQRDFKTGLIDSDQLASFQRDFSGILTHEEELKTGGGMTKSGEESILKQLAEFEARLDKQAGLNKSPKK